MEKQQRSILLFKNTIKSTEAFDIYMRWLNRFKTHYKLRDFDSIAIMDKEQLQIMVEDYIMGLRSRDLARSTINVCVCAIQAFLDVNDVDLRWKKIKRLMPSEGKKSGKRAWSTKQIERMLEHSPEIRTKALIHFLASTGVRVGSIPDMKLRDIKEMPDGCKSVCVYSGDKEEYYTFLTPEANSVLDEYLQKRQQDGEYLKPESPLFRNSYSLGISPSMSLKRASIAGVIDRILHKSGLRTVKERKRKDIQQNHGFRKRFNTILKTTPGMNNNLAEKMMGHSVSIPLDDVYLDPSIEQLFAEFKKAIPYLTIDDSVQKDMRINEMAQENDNLKTALERNKDYEHQIKLLVQRQNEQDVIIELLKKDRQIK